jgi:DNA-directed RNA polymerase specialized sigma24 family protein
MKPKTNSYSKKEEDLDFATVLGEVLTGRRPFEALLVHSEFLQRATQLCRHITGDAEEAEDLFQESCLKMLDYGRQGLGNARVGRISSFFEWYLILTRNLYRSKMREKGLTIDEVPVEEHPIVAPEVDLEREYLVKEILEYTKTLPVVRQLAFEYWLDGYSSREIAKKLGEMGLRCSHVGVAKWNNQTLRDLGSPKTVFNLRAVGKTRPRAVVENRVAANILRLAEECAVDTGIPDLADQHDRYLYGKPKKEGRDVESLG